MPDTVNKNGVNFALLVEQAMESESTDLLARAIEPLHSAEIAAVLESLPYEQRLFL